MDDPLPLDPQQVRTIGRVHHGMLFQHVLAARFVAQEVLAPGFFEQLVVEHDEDIEIRRATGRIYVQAKAHENLVFSELKESLLRMHKVRVAHANGERSGDCQLFFAIGGSLGAELVNRDGVSKNALETKVRELAVAEGIDPASLVETWRGIGWLTPNTQHLEFATVHFRATANELLTDLAAELNKVPRLANSPSSAAYALSTSMQALAADSLDGFAERRLAPSDIPRLVETVEQHIQTLPDVPTPYVPLPSDHVHFALGETIVLLGSTGSGKSTHLAYEAIKGRIAVLYLLPTESGAAAIRECALQLRQHLISAGVDASQLITPSADVPLAELVKSLCEKLPSNTFVLVDDAHLLVDTSPARALLRGIASRAVNGLVLCGMPQQDNGGSTATTLTTLLGKSVDVIDVPGWTKANVSEFLFLRGTPQDPVVASTLRSITGGHPAAVQALIDLATREFGGNIDNAIAAVRRGTDEGTVSAVVSAHLASLPASARRVASVVALTKLAPELQALEKLLPDEAAAGFRHLLAHRCLTRTPQGFRLHDLYAQAAALAATDTIARDERTVVHKRAASMLENELERTNVVDLVPLWLLNMGLGGDMERVVNILTGDGDLWVEALQRMGIGTPTAHTIERLIPFANPEQCFWLYDCLVFLNYEEELQLDKEQLWRWYRDSYKAAEDPDQDPDDIEAVERGIQREVAYLTKAMRRAKDNRDAGALDVLWIEVQKLQKRTGSLTNTAILNSEYACCLYHLGDHETAWAIALSNVSFHLMLLRLGDEEFWSAPEKQLLKRLQESGCEAAVISRLADALLLLGMCLRELGEWPAEVFARSKFLFEIIGGQKSSYKAELHMARQLGRLKDHRPTAISLMEHQLAEFKRIGFDGGLVATTCTLAALHEVAGDSERAELLLSELAHFDPAEVLEELEEARAQVRPYTEPSWGWRTLGLMRRA